MKFKFITEGQRRSMIVERAQAGKSIMWLDIGKRRYLMDPDTVYLVEGLDEVIGEHGEIAPLSPDETGKVIAILHRHTQRKA